MNKLVSTIMLSICMTFVSCIPFPFTNGTILEAEVIQQVEEPTTEIVLVDEKNLSNIPVEVEVEEQQDISISAEEIELLALVTIAEAEGECEEGKRLVIDTVLNRVDGGSWPNDIYDVIYQPHQFSSMWNGRVNRCTVTDEVRELVREELRSRTDSNVVYFRTSHYSSYGTPYRQVENHYFSTY